AFLAPSDASISGNNFFSTGREVDNETFINKAWLARQLSAVNAKSVLVILDSCYSGTRDFGQLFLDNAGYSVHSYGSPGARGAVTVDRVAGVIQEQLPEIPGAAVAGIEYYQDRLGVNRRKLAGQPGLVDEGLVVHLPPGGEEVVAGNRGVGRRQEGARILPVNEARHPVPREHEQEGIQGGFLAVRDDLVEFLDDPALGGLLVQDQ